jgi:flavin-dependent dehydrogenase
LSGVIHVIYDLIIVGGGPGGVMAARSAARDGLKVLLVEKMKAGRITRFCSRDLRLGAGGFSSDTIPTDVNLKRVTVTIEVGSHHHRLHLQSLPPDAVVDYRGELNPVFNETLVSPSGRAFSRDRSNRDIEGFVVDKEQLLIGLLADAAGAGCVIRDGTRCLSIADSSDGVQLRVTSDAGEEALSARRAIVADGSFSTLVDQLGFNEGRSPGRGRIKFMNLILDRVKFPFPELRRVRFCLPSLHSGIVNMGPWPPGLFQISTAASVANEVNLQSVLTTFTTNSPFSELFAGAKIVARQACNMDLRPPIREAARGNVICVGDNAAFAEVAIKGAMGCGYMAAKCSKDALEGRDGNAAYNDYWQHAFNFFSPQYNRRANGVRSIPEVLTDVEADDLIGWMEDRGISGLPNDVVIEHREQLEHDLPDICGKLLSREKDRGDRQAVA